MEDSWTLEIWRHRPAGEVPPGAPTFRRLYEMAEIHTFRNRRDLEHYMLSHIKAARTEWCENTRRVRIVV